MTRTPDRSSRCGTAGSSPGTGPVTAIGGLSGELPPSAIRFQAGEMADRLRNPSYADFKAQSARQGAFFFAYHWLHRATPKAKLTSVKGPVSCDAMCEARCPPRPADVPTRDGLRPRSLPRPLEERGKDALWDVGITPVMIDW